MTMRNVKLISAAIASLILAACNSDNDRSSANRITLFAGSYIVDAGYSVPVDGEIAVIWSVSSGSPDYSFATIGEFVDGEKFSLQLPTTLQDDAINSYGIAVGIVAGFSVGGGPAAGRQMSDDDINAPFGFSENLAIIYKKPDADDILGWSSEFPVGYSCGRGVPSETSFDSIVPIDCAVLMIRVGDIDTFQGINWT